MFGTFLFNVSTKAFTLSRVPLHFQFPPTMNRPVPSETTCSWPLLPSLLLLLLLFVAPAARREAKKAIGLDFLALREEILDDVIVVVAADDAIIIINKNARV